MAVDLESYLDDLASKDERAFETVYQNTKYSVYAVIHAIVRDPAETEDLMQDTYVRMIRKIHTYHRGGNFNAWLTQIAKNLAYDHLRRSRRVRPYDAAAHPDIFDRPASGSTSDIDFDRLLDGLATEERTIVMLKTVGDRPFAEIAKITGKSVGGVHAVYKKAIAKLAKRLGKE